MERGQGTRLNLYAQRCTLSSIGFSVFSLCLYVLGFLKNAVVNKSSYFYGSHCLLRCVFVPATPFYQATSHMVRWPARAVFHSLLSYSCSNSLKQCGEFSIHKSCSLFFLIFLYRPVVPLKLIYLIKSSTKMFS